jgi:molecular chaperone GrpE
LYSGEAFNPEFHEAVTMIPMPDKKSNSVLEVVQAGFTLNGRLVRPAMVVVVQ